ncbi:MAG: FtsW/RodA/SpoVE family cell cycle protein [Clostridium sp.]|nr:FtsW/RodA/SpoVE family cell cycle protein [Clostridium sp.]
MEQKRIGFFGGLDWVTTITALIGSVYGLALVYSATYSRLGEGKIITSDVRSMLISIFGGIVFALIVCNIDYAIISKLWPIIAGGCILLMLVTLLFGTAANPDRPDARCWLDFKVFMFQTSELLKVGFIISFSYHLDMVKDHIDRLKSIVPLVIHGMIPVALVIATGDSGSALIFLIMFIGMLFFAKVNIGYFIAGICAIIVAFAGAWKFNLIDGIQRERITALFFPEEYADTLYQQTNGKIAMGSGGWFGQGFLNGSMTQGREVPVNESDMIMSVAGEEFGYIGAMAVILLLLVLVLRVLFTGLKARDNVGYLMCSGISVMLFAQIFINVGMELSLLPCIGITLPLFSAGGSSSLCIYLALGIEMSVYRFSKSQNKSLLYA